MTPSTPLNSPKRQEYDTIRRARFFNAWDAKENHISVGQICRKLDFKLPPSTARRWIKERNIQGSPAIRRTRKQSSRLGRKPIVSVADLERLINQQDPVTGRRVSTVRAVITSVTDTRIAVAGSMLDAGVSQCSLFCIDRSYKLSTRERKSLGLSCPLVI
jgi:hypothetical protein